MGNFEETNRFDNLRREMIQNMKRQNELDKKQIDLKQKALENEIEKYKMEYERQIQLDKYNYEQKVKQIDENVRNNDLYHKIESMKIVNDFKNKQKYYNDEKSKINNKFKNNMKKEFLRNDIENNKMKLNFINDNYKIKKESIENKIKYKNEAERDKKNYENIRRIDYLKHQNGLLDIDIQSQKDQIKHLENMKRINDDCLLDKLKTDNEHIIKMKSLKNDYEKKLNEIEREKIKDGIDFIKNL